MVDITDSSLLPVIVQHARSGEVLMLGYMNEEALTATRTSGFVTFYSRSRQRLWQKGETSGHTLRVVEILQDCDGDALLILAEPAGPTCHTGRPSCFFRDLSESEVKSPLPPVAILAYLADRIHARRSTDPSTSYTARLLHGGVDRIGKKIGEEAAELIIAAKNGNPAEIAYELADLIYHSLVLLEQQGVPTEAVWAELTRRYQAS
ncbi:bifunctional phosphoribosyl-AMP cyclohydrolase/phosphoribosyl-ATP diphosphatase HisIE [Chloroflexus sp. Y-396-1]|uniref:bifunctional phosphoribosyl-AMP cyclohydrolase/phosphoribosyl-ATP diphosphatase HisIE n=1 Tax=Chloroflexus sp. Y-396-1 TaxID=867845 RepID=UPI0004922255|nr:bifunctional phosphoribosyl-AMP cyclohydrolase/phosphoribosyl-ATP diphosphatase HisIE [Chloroflexus sp. Y-396-1]